MNSNAVVEKTNTTDAEVILPFEQKREYYVEDLGEVPAKPMWFYLQKLSILLFYGDCCS